MLQVAFNAPPSVATLSTVLRRFWPLALPNIYVGLMADDAADSSSRSKFVVKFSGGAGNGMDACSSWTVAGIQKLRDLACQLQN